ncbi:MAG: family 16 glycosylhydrolase [Paludibacter sp.]|nr:family 16 glycosylhydrolase [Paludibacter sp.]
MKKILFFCALFFSFNLFAFYEVSDLNIAENENTISEMSGSGETNGYKIVWEDNFNDSTLDETNRWTVEVNGDGGGNSELQYYTRQNIRVGVEPQSGLGCLIITAKKQNYLGKTCTSGRLTSQNKMSFKHGKVEARIKFPKTANGLWPAFWMLGTDIATYSWPKCGEIDIVEMGNSSAFNNSMQERYFSGWCHWGESWNNGAYPNWGQARNAAYSLQDDFHLFTLIWDDEYVKMYLDLDKYPNNSPYMQMAINGVDVEGEAAHYFHKQFFVILNLAIGGNFTQIWEIGKVTALNSNNNYTANMYVDFVRVYQKGDDSEEFNGLLESSVKTAKDESNFSLYPVPATDYLKVSGGYVPAFIRIYSMQGVQLLVARNTSELNISELSSGNYIASIVTADGKSESHIFSKK